MIAVKNLTFSYDKKPVLKGISFSIAQGGFTALLGCNGAGKTTLFRCMLGLESGYGGTISVQGQSLRDLTPRQLARIFAYIPQSSYPAFHYTVQDMVLMGTTRHLKGLASPGKQEMHQAMVALETLGIADLAPRSFFRLSGGEKQLVLIARALAQKTQILLMDEPCASLDFGNQARVMQIARQLGQQGYTVLMSTHHPQHVLTYADQVLALHDGRLLQSGTPDAVMNETLLETLYHLPIQVLDTPCGRVLLPKTPTT